MPEIGIPCTKAKAIIVFETDTLPPAVHKEVYLQGLKSLLNRNMGKLTLASFNGDEEGLKQAAAAQGELNAQAIREGKIRYTGGRSDKVSGEVMTEARRLAKAMVKEAMKAKGIKVSHVDASEITKAANAVIADNPEIVEEATANVAARKEKAGRLAKVAEAAGAIPINAAKVEKAEKEKAEKKKGVSAKQAGKVAERPKAPTGPAIAGQRRPGQRPTAH